MSRLLAVLGAAFAVIFLSAGYKPTLGDGGSMSSYVGSMSRSAASMANPDTVTIAITMRAYAGASGLIGATTSTTRPLYRYPYTANYVYEDSIQTLFQYAAMDTVAPGTCHGDTRDVAVRSGPDGGGVNASMSRLIVRWDVEELIPVGADVIDADILICMRDRTSWAFGAGEGFAAVQDTFVADTWWHEPDICHDAWGTKTYWNMMRATDSAPWTPSQASRAAVADLGVLGAAPDGHDPYTAAANDTVSIDALSLVEGIIESGWQNSGTWITVIDDISGGRDHWVTVGNGTQNNGHNPTLYVTYVTSSPVAFNHEKPWDGRELAFVFSADGGYEDLGQGDYLAIADSLGAKLSILMDERKVADNANQFDYATLQTHAANGHDIGYMGHTHASWDGTYLAVKYGMMGVCDPDSLGPNTGMWMDPADWLTGMGTSSFAETPMLAWPAYVYNDTLISKVKVAGFLAARSGPPFTNIAAWNDHPAACWDEVTSAPVLMTWDDPVKIYQIQLSQNFSRISGLVVENPTKLMVAARVDSVITAAMALGTNPVIHFYAHKNKTNSGEIDRDEFMWMMQRLMWDDRVSVMTFRESVEAYRARHTSTDGLIWTLP